MRYRLTSLPRSIKMLIVMANDSVLLSASLYGALALRLGEPAPDISNWPWLFAVAPLIGICSLTLLGVYRTMVRYIAPGAVYQVAKGTAFTAFCLATLVTLTLTQGVPRSIYFIFWLLATVLLAGSRYAVRLYYGRINSRQAKALPVIIYGAGDAGFHLATSMLNGIEYWPVAFIDDRPGLHGRILHGIRVYPKQKLGKLIEEFEVEEVMLAIPSSTNEQRRVILNELLKHPVQVRTIPSIREIVAGNAEKSDLREIRVDDLLGRNPVSPNPELLQSAIAGHSILVTGGGGSIGSELCRQILRLQPSRLVIYELSEFALYAIGHELEIANQQTGGQTTLVSVLGSVQDQAHLSETIRSNQVSVLFHAAAYKHVPIVESNISQGIRNNVFGTLAAARAAVENNLERFVLISTDKAVRPTNVMGASKRIAELITQAYASCSTDTIFCMVRFGNVLGSSGSVVPLFRKQIAAGGPVTVTHPEITRYFMTIPEAAQLVIQAGAMATGGEVFVLDMGDPVRITDLAGNMIRLAGKSVQDADHPNGTIEIRFTGLRPGEKLYEELLIGDNVSGTEHPMIMRADEARLEKPALEQALEALREAIDAGSRNDIVALLGKLVSGYRASASLRADSADGERSQEQATVH